jgi:hypothetical protein
VSNDSRPPVPPDVQQQLRSEALFGCCRCGRQIYQYHHIIPYEVEHHFRPEDMMVLCPICHDMATKKVLRETDQRKFKANPFNRKHGFASGLLSVPTEVCALLLGQNTLMGTGCFIRVDETCLLSLHPGPERQLQISAAIYNRADELMVLIERNEWMTGDPTPWDFESDYQYLKLRSKTNDVLLELRADKQPMRIRAKLWRRGISIDARPSQILINGGPTQGMTMSGNTLQNWCLAISSHSGAGGIVPMDLHPADPLWGPPPKR